MVKLSKSLHEPKVRLLFENKHTLTQYQLYFLPQRKANNLRY